ncbi:MAG TPA: helix-turn-helix transcriptional regulator [Solirubrobacterales bacterium]|jgi:DNA-binding PadR family transcriptional regulator
MELTEVSYIVLALIEEAGEVTPYDLKKMTGSFSGLWALRHDQVYREPERLAAAGLLSERREDGGRRRRRFRLTKAGREALREWRRTPTSEFTELRDPGLLRLLFGAEPEPLAEVQLVAHQERLAEYEGYAEQLNVDTPMAVRRALNAGIGHEREYVRFWRSVLNGEDGS